MILTFTKKKEMKLEKERIWKRNLKMREMVGKKQWVFRPWKY